MDNDGEGGRDPPDVQILNQNNTGIWKGSGTVKITGDETQDASDIANVIKFEMQKYPGFDEELYKTLAGDNKTPKF